jgi:phage shock protein C
MQRGVSGSMMADSDYNPLTLYRNREQGVILGICAGLADYFALPRAMVRGVAMVALLLLTVPTLAAYLIAALVLPLKPPAMHHGPLANAFRRALQRSPEAALDECERLLQQGRSRVLQLEAYVTLQPRRRHDPLHSSPNAEKIKPDRPQVRDQG